MVLYAWGRWREGSEKNRLLVAGGVIELVVKWWKMAVGAKGERVDFIVEKVGIMWCWRNKRASEKCDHFSPNFDEWSDR